MNKTLALFTIIVGLISSPARADDLPAIKQALTGTWYGWDLDKMTAAESGLISVTFRFQDADCTERNTVTWETVVMGKRTERSGTFVLEKSANIFHPLTITWCVRIHDVSSDYSKDSVIHLVNVQVDRDNRVSGTERILKCRDGFYTDLYLRRKLKEEGQQAAPSTR